MRATWATGSRRDHGFTLVELMVVLAIIVLMAAALPLAMNRVIPARRVNLVAERLLSDIHDLQARSAATGSVALLAALPHGYRTSTSPIARAREVSLPSSMQLRLMTADGHEVNALAFYPDGTASAATVEIGTDDRTATIDVRPLTGRVRLHR